MDVRESLNQNKKIGMGVAIAILLVGVVVMAMQVGGRTHDAAAASDQAFFTDDNGKSFFKDDASRLSPFDRAGKQAYRCDVFRGADGKQFVGLIYRHTDSGRREMEAYLPNRSKDVGGVTRRSIEQRGMQVKPAGGDEKSWVLNDDVTSERLQTGVKDASGRLAQLVTP